MKALRRALARLRGVFDVNGGDDALSREMAAHLEFATEDFIRRGMSPADARRAALLEARGLAQAQESYRDQRGIPMIQVFTRNLQFAWRGLTRNPRYAVAILLSLALGIGLNTAIFTVADTVIRRPLPYPDAMNIITIGTQTQPPGAPEARVSWMPFGTLRGWQKSRTLKEVGYFAPRDEIVQGEAGPEHVNGGAVSPNLLYVLGGKPLVGRWFARNESGYPYVVISEALWRRQFNRDPSVVGKALKINAQSLTVIGVLPRGIGLPLGAEFWRPDNGDFGTQIIARPVAGIPDRAIRAELEALGQGIQNLRKAGYTATVVTMPLHEQLFGPARPTLRLLLAAAALFLLIACANVTNLVLARTLERRRELAVRAILGASARSLAGLVAIENMLLAIGGGILGVGIAYLATDVLAAFAPPAISMSRDVTVQGSALGFAVALVLGCCLLVSVVPVLDIIRDRSIFRLSQGGAHGGRGRAMRGTRRVLVVTQLALALVLMAGAGLLLRSVARLTRADHLGFEPRGVVILSLRPFLNVYRGEALVSLTNRLIERAKQVPGVVDVAMGPPPLVGGNGDGFREGFNVIFNYVRPGDHWSKGQMVWVKYIDDHYVDTYGLRVRSGRGFNRSDDSSTQKVVMVNATAARLFLGMENPIGRLVPFPSPTDRMAKVRVVGLVDDALQNDLAQEARPEILVPLAQGPERSPLVNLAVKSSLTAPVVIGTLGRIVREIDPTLAPSRLESLSDVVDASLARHRFVLRLLVIFASLGFVLAIIGLYAVVSYLVAQRSMEIGVRMALGAQRRHVMRLILGEGALMAGIGILIGIPVALAASRLVESLLYEVRAWDAVALGTGTALLAAVALVASWAPARKAAALDPAATLRAD
jgi:predicted permease